MGFVPPFSGVRVVFIRLLVPSARLFEKAKVTLFCAAYLFVRVLLWLHIIIAFAVISSNMTSFSTSVRAFRVPYGTCVANREA